MLVLFRQPILRLYASLLIRPHSHHTVMGKLQPFLFPTQKQSRRKMALPTDAFLSLRALITASYVKTDTNSEIT